MSAIVLTRVRREIESLMKKPPTGISCLPTDDSLKTMEAVIIGADETPYAQGLFKIKINIPQRYPFEPPRMTFITKIYHPNIDGSGRICLELLKPVHKGIWKPTMTIESILLAIQMLLQAPNADDPLMDEIAYEYKEDRKEFDRKAKEWTKTYAVGDKSSVDKMVVDDGS